MTLTYALLNETGLTSHHGCRAVSQVIAREMGERDFRLIAAVRGGERWRKDAQFNSSLETASIIIINGEGTMHSGADSARSILRFIEEYGPCRKQPIALINTIWHNNPDDWLSRLKYVDLLSVRDRASERTLQSNGIPATYAPDLSLTLFPPSSHEVECSAIAWGDSVLRDISDKLLEISHRHGEPFLPIQSRTKHIGKRNDDISNIWNSSTFHAIKLQARYKWKRNVKTFSHVAEYIDAIRHQGLYITGRFHGACLALSAGVPFLVLPSNTPKIENFVGDAGLDERRIVRISDLVDGVDISDWQFSSREQERRLSFLNDAKYRADDLFSDIRKLCD